MHTPKREETNPITLNPGKVIRDRRLQLQIKMADLARSASMNPRTLDAIEKGRIRNPSLKSLLSIAQALQIPVPVLFSMHASESALVHLGDQKGIFTHEFSKHKFRIISYTPYLRELFIGKVIMGGEAVISEKMLPVSGVVFVQAIIGKLCLKLNGEEHLVKEGNFATFEGSIPHEFLNPQLRESSFLLVTTPSFLNRSSR